jgi:hypothetical protein
MVAYQFPLEIDFVFPPNPTHLDDAGPPAPTRDTIRLPLHFKF